MRKSQKNSPFLLTGLLRDEQSQQPMFGYTGRRRRRYYVVPRRTGQRSFRAIPAEPVERQVVQHLAAALSDYGVRLPFTFNSRSAVADPRLRTLLLLLVERCVADLRKRHVLVTVRVPAASYRRRFGRM